MTFPRIQDIKFQWIIAWKIGPNDIPVYNPSNDGLTHWALGEMGMILKEQFSNPLPEFDSSAIHMKLTSEERHLTPLMISQHWFR